MNTSRLGSVELTLQTSSHISHTDKNLIIKIVISDRYYLAFGYAQKIILNKGLSMSDGILPTK